MIISPEIRTSGAVPEAGSWLWKRLTSAGGLGVAAAEPGRNVPPTPEFSNDSANLPNESLAHPAGWILQRRYEGPTDAGLFFAGAQGVVFLGATRQLAGAAWCNAAPFHYCGAIGPLLLHPAEAEAWTLLGEGAARYAGLSGLFGIDAVRPPLPEGSGVSFRPLIPVDLNPRYTASVEVLERAFGAAAHASLRPELAAAWPAEPGSNDARNRVVGKAVVFADSPRVVSTATSARWMDLSRAGGRGDDASRADVPHPGMPVGAGEPIVTVFASGPTFLNTFKRLRAEAAAALDESLR